MSDHIATLGPAPQSGAAPSPVPATARPSRGRWLSPLLGLVSGVVLTLSLLTPSPREAASMAIDRARRLTGREAAGPGRRPGAWGQLEVAYVELEPPPDLLSPTQCLTETPPWMLPGYTLATLAQLLERAVLPPAQQEALLRTASCDDGPPPACLLQPSLDLIQSLSRQARAVLYGALAADPVNAIYFGAFRRRPAEFDRWLASSDLRPEVRHALHTLAYRSGEFMAFADLAVLCARFPAPEDRVAIVRALSRSGSLLAKLQVPRGAPVDALVRFWGGGGRARDVRPLLESVARTGGAIDVSHLMPPLPRSLLYSYQTTSSQPHNCHWTAMNFFARDTASAQDRYADAGETIAALQVGYQPVPPSDVRFGDVVIFLHSSGELLHSGVYVADGIVFTKNGTSHHRPFILAPLQDLRDEYRRDSMVAELYYRARSVR